MALKNYSPPRIVYQSFVTDVLCESINEGFDGWDIYNDGEWM